MSRNHDNTASTDTLTLLRQRFERQPVAELDDLCQTVKRSGRTVFRALERLGYHSSYSHAGRYYTLRGIPQFDAHGVWFCRDVRFSRHGTLRATVEALVKQATAGFTHEELQALLALRVQDTLRSLVKAGRLGRERVQARYVYSDTAPQSAAAQLEQRRQQLAPPPQPTEPTPLQTPLDLARVVDVLVAVIHAPKDDARGIAARLKARGLDVSTEQVEAVLTRYGVVKKTAPSRSRRSRR
jgi:hypothetical protein